MHAAISLLLLLFFGHALADYPLQGEFLTKHKNHTLDTSEWRWGSKKSMFAHSTIHAGFVLLFTGSALLALAELVIHFATDYSKCDGRITSNQDQAIHYACKVAWWAITVFAPR